MPWSFVGMCTVSKVSYRIGIINWYRYHIEMTDKQTFNDTFYDDINKDRARLTQKIMIFFY